MATVLLPPQGTSHCLRQQYSIIACCAVPGEVPGSMGLGTSGSGSSLASMGRAQLNNLSSSLLMPPGGSMAMHSLQTHDTTMPRSYPLSPSSGPSSSRQQDRYALPGLNAELGI